MIYNIKENILYDNPLASYDTGNQRKLLSIRPKMGPSDYTGCYFGVSENDTTYPSRVCRLATTAQNGSQPSYDVLIDGIELRKIL